MVATKYEIGDFILDVHERILYRKKDGSPCRLKSNSVIMRLLLFMAPQESAPDEDVFSSVYAIEAKRNPSVRAVRLKILFSRARKSLDDAQDPPRYLQRDHETRHFKWGACRPVPIPSGGEEANEDEMKRRDFLIGATNSGIAQTCVAGTAQGALQHSIFVPDTVMFQLAGELIFEVASTFEERRSRCFTYLRALEDVAFLVLFAPRFGVAGDLVAMRDEHPGQILLNHVAINADNFVPQLVLEAPSIEAVLAISHHRANIGSHLENVEKAFASYPVYYNDHTQRDAMSFLGNDPSALRKSFRGIEQVSFDPKRQWPTDPELQGRIDKRFIESQAKHIKPTFPNHHTAALEEFASLTCSEFLHQS